MADLRDGWPAFPPPARNMGCSVTTEQTCRLRDALEPDDGQMLPACLVAYFQHDVRAGRVANRSLWPGTRGFRGPVRPWSDPGRPVRRLAQVAVVLGATVAVDDWS